MAEENQKKAKNVENPQEAVVLEDEKELLLDHNYDGIKELDHPLPSWWTATFIGGIIFGVFYAMYYLVADGPTLREVYEQKMAKIEKTRQEASRDVGNFERAVYAEFKGEEGLAKGQEVFQMNCQSCHAQKGRGDIGPNLTDNHWLVAEGTAPSIYDMVVHGNEENGMPAWGEILSKKEMYAVTAYVRSLHGLELEDEKEPEGEYIDPKTYGQE